MQLCIKSAHFGGCEHTHRFIITYYNELWTKSNQVTSIRLGHYVFVSLIHLTTVMASYTFKSILVRSRNIQLSVFYCDFCFARVGCYLCCVHKGKIYNLHSTVSLKQPKCNTVTSSLNSFRYKDAKIWNDLPNKIKNFITLVEFKNQIKKWQGPKCLCNMCTRLL